MIRQVDTSFIIFQQDNNLVCYYDTKHILDYSYDIESNARQILNDYSIQEDKQATEKLLEFFQQNWTRFFLIRQQPIISCLTMEENYKMFYEIVKAKINYEKFSTL